jgi:hypothetical protein
VNWAAIVRAESVPGLFSVFSEARLDYTTIEAIREEQIEPQ